MAFNDSPNDQSGALSYREKAGPPSAAWGYQQPQPNNNMPIPQTNQQQHVSPELFRQGVLEHAVYLGMDPIQDKSFLWIAERSLVAPLPSGWVQLKTEGEGHPYYYNSVSDESRWDHPSDDQFRELFRRKKEEVGGGLGMASPRFMGGG